MSKVVEISILGKISGNVNADEVIGTRITLKKMYSSGGEVLPFVSARAVKYAIRQALKEKGFEIDPLQENPKAEESLRLADTGNPIEFIDNDLFGYMVTKGRNEVARKRQAPVAFSYFKALKDTPIKAEFAARFPRKEEKEKNPVPFEVEVAEFIGKLN
jgi:CRISPR-associated protein Cst2